MTRPLSIRDVASIVERMPDLSGMMLVGGQAVNFWAEELGIADPNSTGIYGAAVSEDIDFLGSAKVVLAFAKAVNGKARIVGFEDAHGPNSGIVTFDFEGETRHIDFLAHMAGFLPQELPGVLKWAVSVPLLSTSAKPLLVMHPAHCLQAQLENIYGSLLNRRAEADGARYVSRIRLVVEACRRMGQRYLNASNPKSALALAEYVHHLSLLRSSMRARFTDDVRLEDAIFTGPGIPEKFLTLRLPQMRGLREYKQKKYEKTQAGTQK